MALTLNLMTHHFEIAQSRQGRSTYVSVAEAFRALIEQGVLLPGEPLPSSREIAETLGIHRQTAMAALQELKAQGWTQGDERSRQIVSADLPLPNNKVSMVPPQSPKKPAGQKAFWEQHLLSDLPLNFQGGKADFNRLPLDEIARHMSSAIRQSRVKDLWYGSPTDDEVASVAVAEYLRRWQGFSMPDVILTAGTTEGLYVCSRVLIAPGDTVAVENPGYIHARKIFESCQATIEPIGVDDQGLIVDELEELLKKKKIKFVYTTPLHQFPTTVTLSPPRREKLLWLAAKYDFYIFEDDYAHEFHYASLPLAPLATRDKSQRVFYFASFSKLLFPSARAGFLICPAGWKNKVTDHLFLMRNCLHSLWWKGFASWMQSGGMERHIRRQKRLYAERLQVLFLALEEEKEKGAGWDCRIPSGGMSVWLRVPADACTVSQLAEIQGVHVVSGKRFWLKHPSSEQFLRLGFASLNPQEIRKGVRILAKIVKLLRE